MRRELLLGCGNRRIKELHEPAHKEFENVTTVDIYEDCKPDICVDLNSTDWDLLCIRRLWEQYDEVHAYEVLEHLGRQGDEESFFRTFRNIWLTLKNDGMLYASVPSWSSLWAWGDPGHKRIINEGTLAFLDQNEYARQVGKTPMTDYRNTYWAPPFHFVREFTQHNEGRFYFALRKSRFPTTLVPTPEGSVA